MLANAKVLVDDRTVPKIVPSGRLDALSSEVDQRAEIPDFTSKTQSAQMPLNC